LLYNPATGDHKTWTRWGRVGDRGQNAILGSGPLDDAVKQFDKKFKDKSGLSWDDRAGDPKKGKYAYLERSYGQDDEDEVATKASGAAGMSYPFTLNHPY
jgi:poly [ADP-ribose] polymerase